MRWRTCFSIPLPYNAHSTASDALRMGLPLITCRGESFPGRVGASLLHAVGLPELVAADLHDYETYGWRLTWRENGQRLPDDPTSDPC